MKIEKVNENQIRCTLTREDLISRELKISELAYGTEKAKNLFRDMMQQAHFEFGFEAEDIPLMIEAIPLNSECIVLIVTKVEDPDELDTRFARFAPSVMEDDEDYDDDFDPASEVLDFFRKLREPADTSSDMSVTPVSSEAPQEALDRTIIFAMDSLQQVMNAAAVSCGHFKGQSKLYKEEPSGRYLLVLQQQGMDAGMFNKVCNTISEYGTPQRTQSAGKTFLAEHYEALISENALGLLGQK
ncbi:MAG: adaptor protein MecA [Bacteroidales bacterium]|nr:adaptor protein MecA [Lachnoclostridium sp.]MCM1383832.1 adaptor protein MecA [Lachnoclostridium sp.]MCM1464515.1 adaptor protein MecA [Bacteroidales bacterium]